MNRLFGVVLLLAAFSAFAQQETQDDAISTALRPAPGGPATVGDPARVTDLSVTHEETDFVMRTGIGDVPIVRKYSAVNTWAGVWAEPQWFGTGPVSNGNAQVSWWTSLASYAVESSQPFNPNTGDGWTKVSIREPAGTLLSSGDILPFIQAGLPTTFGGPEGTRMVRSATGDSYLLVRPGEGRYRYTFQEPAIVVGTTTFRRFKLTAIFPDRYNSTDTSSEGTPICTFAYEANSARMIGADCFGGFHLGITRSIYETTLTWGPVAGPQPVVLHYLLQGNFLDVTKDGFGTARTAWSNAWSGGSFQIHRGAFPIPEWRMTSTKMAVGAGTAHCNSSTGWIAGAATVSAESTPIGTISYTPSPVRPNCTDPFITSAAETNPAGETITRTFTANRAKGYTTNVGIACQVGGQPCTSISSAQATWTNNSQLPEPTTTLSMDFRGAFTKTTAVSFCAGPNCLPEQNPIQNTEILSRLEGATDANGTNALQTSTMTWQYASGRGRFDQLPNTLSRPSVLSVGNQTTTTWKFDSVTKRPTAMFRQGYTRAVNGVISQKILATFFYSTSKCNGGAPDPLDRVIEVHGPCVVSSLTATQCPSAVDEYVPVTRFEYYAATEPESRGGRLSKKSVATAATTSTSCGTAWLDTNFVLYDDRGHVLRESDANGVLTLRTYQGDRLMKETVGSTDPNNPALGATTRYFYNPKQAGRLSAKRSPAGVWEVYCYRTGSNADCSTGTSVDALQWKARVQWTSLDVEPSGAALTFIDRTSYTYAQAAGGLSGSGQLAKEESEAPISDLERRIAGYGYDGLGRVVSNQVIRQSGALNYRSPSLFDENGNVLGAGDPWNNPPDRCGGQVTDPTTAPFKNAASALCIRNLYDRLNRLSRVTQASGQQTTFVYDGHGNVGQVSQSLGGVVAQYTHDDFGNVVTVIVGTQGAVLQELDARGNLRKKQSNSNGVLVEYRYDGLNRPLDARIPTATLWAYGYDQKTTPAANCPTGTGVLGLGRAQWKDDSFGRTWYAYNALGQVTDLRRVRAGATACSAFGQESADATPDTKYLYADDGRLTGMKYPHGRWLDYTYGTGGNSDRVVRIRTNLLGYTGTTFTAPVQTLVANVKYGVDGAVLGYDTGGSPRVNVEWIRGGSAPVGGACATGFVRPLTSDGSGNLWGLRLTRGSGVNVFSRYYNWTNGQITAESSCVLDDADSVATAYSFDSDLQVTSGGQGWTSFNAKGGQSATRLYQYINGSDRRKSVEDGNLWQFEYDPASRRMTSALPKESTCFSSTCGARNYSWDRKDFSWDGDGRMTFLADSRLPDKQVCTPACVNVPQYGKAITLSPDDGYGSVYKSVVVNGGTYQYLYDAQGRRRLKVYPIGDTDEFFYDGDALIEDRGQFSLSAPGCTCYNPDLRLDEYVWLGGMPVAVIKTTLSPSFVRSSTTSCSRNDEPDTCGTYFPVSDHLPKVVAIVTTTGTLAGVGEYDVFGRVNEVAVRKDVPAGNPPVGSWMPYGMYFQNQPDTVFAALKQPARTAQQRVKMRVNYAQVNTPGTVNSATDRTWVEAAGAQVAPVWTAFPPYHYYAGPLYAVTTNWFDVPTNGQVNVRWTSGIAVPASRYSGATVRSYEYRRFEVNTTPTWVPLRFPGQYADAETGLFENWNRFYDPSTGRYSASDPALSRSAAGVVNLGNYEYARSNPLTKKDPSGLTWNFVEQTEKRREMARIKAAFGLVMTTKMGSKAYAAIARSPIVVNVRVDNKPITLPTITVGTTTPVEPAGTPIKEINVNLDLYNLDVGKALGAVPENRGDDQVVAHEFGHILQLISYQEVFVPLLANGQRDSKWDFWGLMAEDAYSIEAGKGSVNYVLPK